MTKLSSNFNRAFKRFDIFLEPLSLYMDGKRASSSCTGGIFSLLFYILTTSCISILLIEMLNHENLTVYENFELKTESPEFNLISNDNFDLAVLIQYGDGSFMSYNESIVGIRAEFTNSSGMLDTALLVPCNFSNLGEVMAIGLYESGFTNEIVFCFDKMIDAMIIPDGLDFIIAIEPCHNTSQITCKDPEKIQKAFKDGRLTAQIYLTNYMIDVKNYDEPIQPTIYEASIAFTPEKIVVIGQSEITEISCESNQGYFGQTEKVSSFELSRFVVQYSFTGLEDIPYYAILAITPDRKTAVTYRTYSNVLTILAASGGLSKSVFFLFGMIVTMYQRSKFQVKIVSKYFDLSLAVSNKYKKKKVDKSVEIPLMTNQVSLEDDKGQPQGKNSPQIVKNLELKKIFIENRPPKFSLMTYMRETICCSKNADVEIYKTAKQAFMSSLDVLELLRKLGEIDKLKEILLNEKQKKLFAYSNCFGGEHLIQFIEKQKMNQAFHFSHHDSHQQKLSRLENYYLAYTDLKKSKHKDVYSERLLDNVDADLKELFEEIYAILGDDFSSNKFYTLIMDSLNKV